MRLLFKRILGIGDEFLRFWRRGKTGDVWVFFFGEENIIGTNNYERSTGEWEEKMKKKQVSFRNTKYMVLISVCLVTRGGGGGGGQEGISYYVFD